MDFRRKLKYRRNDDGPDRIIRFAFVTGINMGGHQKEQGAWDTLTWFAALVMLANFLNELGMVSWFSDMMKSSVSGFSWIVAFMILIVVYYYTHYFFASATAHISAMYAAFLAVIVAAGAPPLLAALSLAFFSNLFGSTTHYGSGAAPVFSERVIYRKANGGPSALSCQSSIL